MVFIALVAQPNALAFWETLDDKELSQQQLDAHVKRLMSANDVKGLALALIDDGNPVHVQGYGKRMVEKDLPMEANTIIYGASLTKSTFAFYVMSLVDKGIVDLDKSIAEYLPKPLGEYPQYADIASDDRWRALTFRYLLSHRSGFQNWRFLPQEGGYDPKGKLEFYFTPGERYAYSGEGFLLAQRVLEWGLFTTPYGRAFFKEGHDDGTANYAICIDKRKKCVLLMSNSLRAEGIFNELIEVLLGDTRLPWKWEGYVPYDMEERANPDAKETP